MTTPTAPEPTELTDSPSTQAVLDAARQLLTAVVQHARTEGEQARAEVALAHLDDVWPLPVPVETADVADIAERGAVLLDEAMNAVVNVVVTAPDAQARARGLRAIEVLTSHLDMPGDVPGGTSSGQP